MHYIFKKTTSYQPKGDQHGVGFLASSQLRSFQKQSETHKSMFFLFILIYTFTVTWSYKTMNIKQKCK